MILFFSGCYLLEYFEVVDLFSLCINNQESYNISVVLLPVLCSLLITVISSWNLDIEIEFTVL